MGTVPYFSEDAIDIMEDLENIQPYNDEEAVAAYCRMFNTTEKEIRKSKFKDETLGYTLYDLAMQYANIDISKTYYYASLAAKSGNAAAMDYCQKSKISY